MITNFKRFLILFISIIYSTYLIIIFIANFYYEKSALVEQNEVSIEQALVDIDRAIAFNPLNAEGYCQKYYLLKLKSDRQELDLDNYRLAKESINSIKTAIELQPTNASYHMFYALSLIKYSMPQDKRINKLIKDELRKAAGLKPFSKLYQETYNKYISNL